MLVALESPQNIRLRYYRHDAPDNPPATTFPMVRLPAISVPRSRTLRSDNILFYHPGYPTPVNILFSLPRVDQSPSQPDLFGVDAQIALLACQIVASNVFATGYLASDDKGIRRADTGPDSVLTQSEYWFFVEGDGKRALRVPSNR